MKRAACTAVIALHLAGCTTLDTTPYAPEKVCGHGECVTTADIPSVERSETTLGTLVMNVGITAVVAGLLGAVARGTSKTGLGSSGLSSSPKRGAP